MSAVIESPPLFIRPMSELDLDDVMSIETRIYNFPWTRQIFNDCLRVGYISHVCELDNQHGFPDLDAAADDGCAG